MSNIHQGKTNELPKINSSTNLIEEKESFAYVHFEDEESHPSSVVEHKNLQKENIQPIRSYWIALKGFAPSLIVLVLLFFVVFIIFVLLMFLYVHFFSHK